MGLVGIIEDLSKESLDEIEFFKSSNRILLDWSMLFQTKSAIKCEIGNKSKIDNKNGIDLVVEKFHYFGIEMHYNPYSLEFNRDNEGLMLKIVGDIPIHSIPLSIPSEDLDGFLTGGDYYLTFSPHLTKLGLSFPSVIDRANKKIMIFDIIDIGGVTSSDIVGYKDRRPIYRFETLELTEDMYTIGNASKILLEIDRVFTEIFLRNEINSGRLAAKREDWRLYLEKEELKDLVRRPVKSIKDKRDYGIEEIARRFNVSEDNVNEWINEGAFKLKDGLIMGYSAAQRYSELRKDLRYNIQQLTEHVEERLDIGVLSAKIRESLGLEIEEGYLATQLTSKGYVNGNVLIPESKVDEVVQYFKGVFSKSTDLDEIVFHAIKETSYEVTQKTLTSIAEKEGLELIRIGNGRVYAENVPRLIQAVKEGLYTALVGYLTLKDAIKVIGDKGLNPQNVLQGIKQLDILGVHAYTINDISAHIAIDSRIAFGEKSVTLGRLMETVKEETNLSYFSRANDVHWRASDLGYKTTGKEQSSIISRQGAYAIMKYVLQEVKKYMTLLHSSASDKNTQSYIPLAEADILGDKGINYHLVDINKQREQNIDAAILRVSEGRVSIEDLERYNKAVFYDSKEVVNDKLSKMFNINLDILANIGFQPQNNHVEELIVNNERVYSDNVYNKIESFLEDRWLSRIEINRVWRLLTGNHFNITELGRITIPISIQGKPSEGQIRTMKEGGNAVYKALDV